MAAEAPGPISPTPPDVPAPQASMVVAPTGSEDPGFAAYREQIIALGNHEQSHIASPVTMGCLKLHCFQEIP